VTIEEVLYHWWMWAYHKGAESYWRARAEDIEAIARTELIPRLKG
jgi:hypothetical protein